MEKQWRQGVQILIGVALIALLSAILFPFFTPLILGAILALLSFPLYERNWGLKNRYLKGFCVVFVIWLAILFPFNLGLFLGFQKIFDAISTAQGSILNETQIQNIVQSRTIKNTLEWIATTFSTNSEWLTSQGLTLLKIFLQRTSLFLGNLLSSAPSFFLNFFVVILSHFFFLVDGRTFLSFLYRLSPLPPERTMALYTSFESSSRAVILGLVLSALAQGAILYVSFLITGVPYASLFALVAIVSSFVPLLGTLPVSVGGVFYLISQKQPGMALLMVIVGILASTVDNFIRPAIMKGGVNLHPFLALISVFGGIHLLGYSGIFLGPILATVTITFLKTIPTDSSLTLK